MTEAFVRSLTRALQRVVEEFVYRNMRLVFKVTGRYRMSGVPEDDLVQRGALGLMRAAHKFEPVRQYRFCTYALWWVKQAVSRGVHDEAHLVRRPTHMQEIDRKVRRGRARIAAATGREATDQELAQLIAKPEKTVRRVTEAQTTIRVMSLDAPRDEEGEGLYGIVRGNDVMPSGEDLLEMRERAMLARELLATLDSRDRQVLSARFGEETETLAAIGGTHGVSRERVRQLEARALETLRRRAALRETRKTG
jgi:RNA polymerase primary sigma factor